MGRKRIPKPKPEAECQYCTFFFQSPVKDFSVVRKPRLCVRSGNEIHSNDVVCEKFEITPYFFCDRSTHQLQPRVCQIRRERKHSDCWGCKQWKEVDASLAINPGPEKPRLKIRAISRVEDEQEEPVATKKPILKKRAIITI